MGDISAVESVRIPNPIEQKVRDAFGDYPIDTQRGIVFVLEQQSRNWQQLRSDPKNLFLISAVKSGLAYATNIPSIHLPKRPLTDQEILERQELLSILAPFKRTNTYGIPSYELPNTRFYLSLNDSQNVTELMIELTQELIALQKRGAIPFFQYKFDSFDQSGNLRFDPVYRDKGASPILYVADGDIERTQRFLESLASRYPEAFLSQIAPFKFSPHKKGSDLWHIAMEAGNLVNNGTPEQGMKKATSEFLAALGLTTRWTPIQSLDVWSMRDSWEKSTALVHRQPKQPWITTDRPTPAFFTE